METMEIMKPKTKGMNRGRAGLGYHRDSATGRLSDEDDPWDDSGHCVEPYENPIGSCRPSEKGPIALTKMQIERFRDLMIIRLMISRVSTRAIGEILGIDQKSVLNRYNAVPANTKRHYAKADALDLLGRAGMETD